MHTRGVCDGIVKLAGDAQFVLIGEASLVEEKAFRVVAPRRQRPTRWRRAAHG